jgi:uncharacterized glyoxalase superfamily protein PhnB
MAVKTIPDGFHSVCAYLNVQDAEAAIAFYRRALALDPRNPMALQGAQAMGLSPDQLR